MSAIQRTSPSSVETVQRLQTEAPEQLNSTSRIAERLSNDGTFWAAWLRLPSVDLAESLMRLRRIRHMTQSDLAESIGTKQPGIARLESGESNPRLSTLVAAAEALNATIRIEMEPIEYAARRPRIPAWWEGDRKPFVSAGGTYCFVLHSAQFLHTFSKLESESIFSGELTLPVSSTGYVVAGSTPENAEPQFSNRFAGA
jgi:transcriptional regulator with XRE-family HTH domain